MRSSLKKVMKMSLLRYETHKDLEGEVRSPSQSCQRKFLLLRFLHLCLMERTTLTNSSSFRPWFLMLKMTLPIWLWFGRLVCKESCPLTQRSILMVNCRITPT